MRDAQAEPRSVHARSRDALNRFRCMLCSLDALRMLITDSAAASMPEMPTTGKHHGDAALVGGGDHFVVAHAAAGLDHRDGAGVGDDVEAVAKREEGVGRDNRAGERQVRHCCALIAAMRAESTRLIWPAPTPSVCPLPQNTIAFDLTNLATRQANSRSCKLLPASAALASRLSDRRGRRIEVIRRLHRRPPPTRLKSSAFHAAIRAVSGTSSTRTFSSWQAASQRVRRQPGAISTSTNCSDDRFAVARVELAG